MAALNLPPANLSISYIDILNSTLTDISYLVGEINESIQICSVKSVLGD